jgi:PAS domain S-box-containing protein
MARTLLTVSLAVGLILSILAATFMLLVGFSNLEDSAEVIERIVVPQLASMLWEFNPQTENYVRSTLYLPYVNRLDLETDHGTVSLVDPAGRLHSTIEREYILSHQGSQTLGILHVSFSRQEVLEEALQTAGMLVLVLLGALGAAFLVQYRLFRIWIAHPLVSLSELAGALTLDTLDKPLSWSQWSSGKGTAAELDGLALSLEGMRQTLHVSLGERDRLREELLGSEERYREVFDSAGDAILIHQGQTTRIIQANRAALSLFKTTEEFLLSSEGFAAFLAGESPYDAETALAIIARCVKLGPQLVEWRARDSKGRNFWIEASITAVVIRGNLQVISSIRDIDARKKAENEAFHLQRLDSIGRLAGGIAHDFNNTLQAIMAECELGILDAEPDSPAVLGFKAIKDGVQNSAKLTRQLLTFAHKEPVNPKILDLNASLTSMHTLFKRLVPELIELVVRPFDSPLPVLIDSAHLDQLLTNLVVNARDAIRGPGRITIASSTIHFSEDDVLSHPGLTPGAYAQLEVGDSGCGMSPEVLEHIFEPFFTTKPADKGTGLGLSTVFGIMQQCKGAIKVYSEPGHGTVFRLFLPLSGSKPESSTGKDRNRWPGKGELIVLVDDDHSIARGGERQLKALGYEPWVFDDPLQACSILEQTERQPALLITDLVMPGMSGIELNKRLTARFPTLRTLFVSGYPAELLPEGSGQVLLSKPYTLDQLAAALEGLMSDTPAGEDAHR